MKSKDKNWLRFSSFFIVFSLPLYIISGPRISKILSPKIKIAISIGIIVLLIITIGFVQSQTDKSTKIYPPELNKIVSYLPDGSKVLQVPYFNQYREADGSFNPSTGWQMCGAAAVVMVTAFFNKIDYGNDKTILKRYLYEDMDQHLPRYCINYSGAFSITAKGYCNQSSFPGLEEYLHFYNLKTKTLSINFNDIKQAIDIGHPLILSTNYPWGHIFVAKGYTLDGKVIANDSFKNWQDGSADGDNKAITYSYNGEGAVYDLNYKVYDRAVSWNYMLEISL